MRIYRKRFVKIRTLTYLAPFCLHRFSRCPRLFFSSINRRCAGAPFSRFLFLSSFFLDLSPPWFNISLFFFLHFFCIRKNRIDSNLFFTIRTCHVFCCWLDIKSLIFDIFRCSDVSCINFLWGLFCIVQQFFLLRFLGKNNRDMHFRAHFKARVLLICNMFFFQYTYIDD